MVRIDDSEDTSKCWLNQDEIKLVEEYARREGWEKEIAIQFMAKCGMRASEVEFPKPSKLSWNGKGEYWQMEIYGKNTKGGNKTLRDAYIPNEVKENLDRFQSERDIRTDERYIDKSIDTVRRWVREITNTIAEEEDRERFRHVSSHDLRRSWATYHLVEKGVNVRVMMEVGGWSSYQAIEPYLGKPTAEKIGEEMS